MGLLLNHHDAPSNSLEMVVQDLGGGSPCGPRFPIPLSQVPLGRSRKYPLVTCVTPKDDWFLDIPVGSPHAFGGSTSTTLDLVHQ